ncbi:hypothetical protein [Streptomyces prasinus]|uniref:hypothetical protein n=1 Tax=Streptomyces prasinus TaxID=67345 RepID=UPI0036B6C2E4
MGRRSGRKTFAARRRPGGAAVGPYEQRVAGRPGVGSASTTHTTPYRRRFTT